jgi:hypothetical protein
MNPERHLPEDLKDWPNNPYELLDVPREIDCTGLRRAYVGLIRRYKPEHFPDHFRRIREAYDAILHWIEWKSGSANSISNISSDSGPIGIDMTDSFDSQSSNYSGGASQTSGKAFNTFQTEIEQAWNLALSGDVATGYQRLVEIEQRDRGEQTVCLRLYWLLKLYRELDKSRTPIDWLLCGIVRNHQLSPLLHLYCREIDDHPEEGVSDRCTELLRSIGAAPSICPLAFGRWRAARKLECWNEILTDIDELRGQISQKNSALWAQLLVIAFDHLAWCEDPSQLQSRIMLAELESIPESRQLAETAQLRFDFLRWIRMEYPRAKENQGLTELVELIPDAWPQPDWEVRTKLLKALRPFGADPRAAMRTFDQFAKYGGSLLAYLVDCARSLVPDQRRKPGTADEIAAEIHVFIRLVAGRNYSEIRASLLELCLREQIAPDQLAMLPPNATYLPLPAGQTLVDVARADAPICLAYFAHHAVSR